MKHKIRKQEQRPCQEVNSGLKKQQCRVENKRARFSLGIASFSSVKPASEMGHKKFLGKSGGIIMKTM